MENLIGVSGANANICFTRVDCLFVFAVRVFVGVFTKAIEFSNSYWYMNYDKKGKAN